MGNHWPIPCGADAEFGYPERHWDSFGGGDVLLAAVGEREVRYRLKHRQSPVTPVLQGGSAAECAERLLMLELGLQSPEALLSAPGNERAVLVRRLEAVGLRSDGSSQECAERL